MWVRPGDKLHVAPEGVDSFVQVASAQLGVSMLVHKQGKSLMPYPTQCPASPCCFHHGAVSHLSRGQLATPGFCSSFLCG